MVSLSPRVRAGRKAAEPSVGKASTEDDPIQVGVSTIGKQKLVCIGLAEDLLEELRKGKAQMILGQELELGYPVDILFFSGKSGHETRATLVGLGKHWLETTVRSTPEKGLPKRRRASKT